MIKIWKRIFSIKGILSIFLIIVLGSICLRINIDNKNDEMRTYYTRYYNQIKEGMEFVLGYINFEGKDGETGAMGKEKIEYSIGKLESIKFSGQYKEKVNVIISESKELLIDYEKYHKTKNEDDYNEMKKHYEKIYNTCNIEE